MNFSPVQKLKMSLLVLLSIGVFSPVLTMAAPSTLVIDEFRVDGATGSKDEYVVIANYGVADIDLNQYALTIKTSNTTYQYLYRFLAGSSIGAKQKIKICHGSNSDPSSCDLFYSISATSTYEMKQSGVLALINLANNKENIDVVGYGEIDYGASGCWATGCEKFPLESPPTNTPYKRVNGSDTDNSNVDFEAIVTPIKKDLNANKLVISELLPNPETGAEWFELYNPTNLDISLANLKICDALGSRHCYFFDDTDNLPANGYKTYEQSLTKITLNNTGDWLELYDTSDTLITDSGGDYGSADKGVALALFGNEYRWTKTPTPAGSNIFTDIIEIEADTTAPVAKTAKSKVVTAAKKKIAVKTNSTSAIDEEPTQAEADVAVRAAETKDVGTEVQNAVINKKSIGWALIGLAIMLVIGYTLWYFRDYARNIYHKIRPGDDSARF